MDALLCGLLSGNLLPSTSPLAVSARARARKRRIRLPVRMGARLLSVSLSRFSSHSLAIRQRPRMSYSHAHGRHFSPFIAVSACERVFARGRSRRSALSLFAHSLFLARGARRGFIIRPCAHGRTNLRRIHASACMNALCLFPAAYFVSIHTLSANAVFVRPRA